jgi:hypothetical protein
VVRLACAAKKGQTRARQWRPKHVIHADAEITIRGSGSMSIRLTRKRGSGDASLPMQ